MEKKITISKDDKLKQEYYILKMRYRLLYGRYLQSLKETNKKHEEAVVAHKELLAFISANGKYDNVCPPSNNKLIS